MTFENLFDYAAAQQARDNALERVANNPENYDWVATARQVAIEHAKLYGRVTINDVLKKCPRPSWVNPNATGSVVKIKELRKIGYEPSDKVAAHARPIGIYVVSS